MQRAIKWGLGAALGIVTTVPITAPVFGQAQEQPTDQAATAPAPMVLDYEAVYAEGIRGERFLDADVYGFEGGDPGEEIGDVENVLIDEEGQIVAVIAEVGGLWDIGDQHVVVPWDQGQLFEDGIMVPVDEENVEDFDMFGITSFVTVEQVGEIRMIDDDVTTGPRIWKLTNLIDDYAALPSGAAYGYVDDVVFSPQGKVIAVVVDADTAFGGQTAAFPYRGLTDGWEPRGDIYPLPFTEQEVAAVEPFDQQEINEGVWE